MYQVAHDGSGQRIEQEVNVSGVKTTTAYLLGGVEERASTGTITKYLGDSGLPTAIRVGTSGPLNYLAQDGLGSMSEAFDSNGNETAAQLYTPYGTVRYATGTMPTAKGFTGQRADVTTGLDYYGARYYDASAGQFTSADSVADGLSPYAYVAGNPETATDPSGHLIVGGAGQGGGNSGCQDGSQNCSGGCTSDANCGCYGGASSCGNSPGPHSCTSDANCGCYISAKQCQQSLPPPGANSGSCQSVCSAKHAATNAAKYYNDLSNDITYLVNRLGILGTALIALFPEVAEIGIILDLLAFDLNTMAGDAAWLSNEFGSVNSGYDDNDPFWSSFTGLEGMRQDITARLASHRNTYTGVLAGLDTANAMLMQVKQHDLGGDNPTTQQAIGFIDQLTGDVEDVGYGTFAMHTIDLEEQDLNS